ncbi:MAG: glycine-rich domain-containing protein [Nocardioides sp.]
MPRAVFTSSGTWTVPAGVTSLAHLLVVAGGGSGGGAGSIGGGGGAGGVLYLEDVAVTPGADVTVTVGAGGAQISSTPSPGNPGGNSAFGAIVATGGGRGGAGSGNPAGSGGSGGGGGGQATILAGGSGTSGQGNAGGNGQDTASSGRIRGGGGGGAGGAGQNAASGGAGGIGVDLGSVFGTDVGAAGWFGGGGGGGRHGGGSGSGPVGGQGGGGQGGYNTSQGSPGVDGTGGGGGGGAADSTGPGASATLGGAGGNGIVIIIYDDPPTPPATGTATGSAAWSALASGTNGGGQGRGAGTTAWSGEASGATVPLGAAATTNTWAGSAGGFAPGMDPVQVSGASAASLTAPSGRAGKGQRWAWWTGTRWDAVLPTSTGWRILTAVASSPAVGAVVDNRQAARATAVADGDTVWILRGHTSAPRITRYTRSGITYTADGSVTDVAITALAATDGDASPITLHRTPGGRLWAAGVTGGAVTVAISDDDGATWSTSAVESVAETGVAALAHSGSTLVLMVTLNAGAGRLVRTHALTGGIGSGWSSESLPALPSGVTSDDHGHATGDGQVIYWASKTEGPTSSQPLIYLLHRTAGGTWASHTIVTGPDSGVRPTRPAIALTPEHLHVTWGQINAPRAIQHVRLDRADLSSVPAPTTLLGGENFSDGAITPAGVLRAPSGILVLAHDRDSGNAWQARLTVPAPPVGAATGSSAWTGAAAGHTRTAGAASGEAGWSGQASGRHHSIGQGSGTTGWSTTATGRARHRGTGSGTAHWAGTATGHAPGGGGTATGTTSWTAAARGHHVPRGTGTGAAGWTGTATGSAPTDTPTGSAAGVAAWAGTATGTRTARGHATGTTGWTGHATTTPARDITVTTGPPRTRWRTGPPTTRWAAGPPRTT